MSSISCFTFHAPGGMQSHRHKYGHIILVLKGSFYVRFEGQEYTLTPAFIGFVPPDVLHDYSCTGTALTLNIPSEMVKAPDLISLTENCVMEIDDRLEPLVALIKREVRESLPDSGSDSLRYLFYYLYDKFVERHQLSSIRYMREHYADDISISRLAGMENYNTSYYTDWFRKKIGCSPREYLRMVRMDKAREMLATTRYRIIDIALQTGYTNSSSFTRAFRAEAGMTPLEYRRRTALRRQPPKAGTMASREEETRHET